MTTTGHGTGHGTERPARSTLEPLPGSPLSRFLSDGYVATWRNIKKIVRVPDILVFTLIQPIMFVLLFTFVFGSSIDVPGEDYTSFLMAGIFAQTIVFGSTYSGSAMAQDLKDGIIDRFRTLPMNPSAVLIGRTLGDLVINVLSLVVMMLTGLAVGWRVESSAVDFAIGVGLLTITEWSRVLQRNATFGPLVLMAIEMVRDVINFIILLAGAFFAFVAVVAIVSGRTFPRGMIESHDKSPSQAVSGSSGVGKVCHARPASA